MDTTAVYAEIVKHERNADGDLVVTGRCTGPDLDLDHQICDESWLKTAMPAWFEWANVREQHGKTAAGVGQEITALPDGGWELTALVVDRDSARKVEKKVLKGYSIGIRAPRVIKDAAAPGGRIVAGDITEISLVDRPANPSCLLTLAKAAKPGMELNAADYDEEHGLVRCEEFVDTAEKVAGGAKESDMPTLAETLAPEALEKLAAAVEPAELPETPADPAPVEKAADDAPVPATPAGDDGGDTAPAADVDATKALAADLLAKAEGDDMADMTIVAPPSDEELAALAISIIARLIQSEAGDMVSNPGEDDDIRCLLSAIGSLRWYRRRERQEGDIGGVSDSAPYEYAASPDVEKTVETVEVVVDGNVVSPELIAAVEQAAEKAAPVDANELGNLAPADAVTRIKSVSADDAKSIAKATVDTAFETLADSFSRQRGTDDPAPAEKAITPETTKAATVEPDGDALVKALSAALEKADSPLRKSFQDIVTASTETTAQAVTELTARLVKVEGMAVPGGPALRRTEVERTSARKNDLMVEAARLRSLEANTHDQTLVKGYRLQADALEAEIRAISV